MARRATQRLTITLWVVFSLLFSQLVLANYVCPPTADAQSEAMALSMARGEPCESMAMDRDVGQPVLCHQHCLNAPQSSDSPLVPVVSLPAVWWALVVPLLTEAIEDIAILRAEVGQARPPPDPIFLSTLRLRV
ncbi:hypothetical protein [Hydrogenophaga defluvii]|uniref:DUF2946 family protein n=1 Tax=Hydrogenophaga defluvii TaxID=249410 RepID=A0ABW2S760_9BURK